jgi:hypothetical protein
MQRTGCQRRKRVREVDDSVILLKMRKYPTSTGDAQGENYLNKKGEEINVLKK